MMNDQARLDFEFATDIFAGLERRFAPGDDLRIRWEDSPFQWLQPLPPSTKGKMGRQFVEQWLTNRSFNVRPSPRSKSNYVLNGYRIAIKYSALWEGGTFKFQQIKDQDYDICVCLGVKPFAVHAWVVPKRVLLENADGQHTGRRAVETKWVGFDPRHVPDWLREWGGTLAEAEAALRRIIADR